MKALSHFLLVAASVISLSAFADFPHRQHVLEAAESLDKAIEGFDDVLHKITAPKHVTDKVHHADESIEDFVEELDRGQMNLDEAKAEFQHIKLDLDSVSKELDEHPELLRTFESRSHWRRVRRAYRDLAHEMLHAGRPH